MSTETNWRQRTREMSTAWAYFYHIILSQLWNKLCSLDSMWLSMHWKMHFLFVSIRSIIWEFRAIFNLEAQNFSAYWLSLTVVDDTRKNLKRYTAFGFVISKKSTDCGWNLAYVATGREALWTWTMSPSSRSKFLIIYGWIGRAQYNLHMNISYSSTKHLKVNLEYWKLWLSSSVLVLPLTTRRDSYPWN